MGTGSDILAELGGDKKDLAKGEIQRRRYPWFRCVEKGEDKGESAERCVYIACSMSRLPSTTKESGRCKPCGKTPKEDHDAS